MAGCVFCDIVAGRAPASFVYRDDTVTAFLDHRPVTPGHLLVIPNDHLVTLADLDDGFLADITRLGARMASALRSVSEDREPGKPGFKSTKECAGRAAGERMAKA